MTAVYETPPTASETPAAARPDRSQRLRHQPALDGLRGVAVVCVVIFHLDIGVLSAGYLGVSVFFTLSGYLITALLVDEWQDTNGIRIERFYLRRIKRLAPASLLTVAAIIGAAGLGLIDTTSRLRGDVLAAGFNIYNWREVTAGRSYAALFEERSPVAHFWSLAIEAQFYVVWPIVMLLALRYFRADRRLLLVLISAVYAASLGASLLAGPTVVYFATWTRAGEIMAGAALGVWTATSTRTSWPTWWRFLAIPALIAFVGLAAVTPSTTGWAYQGGLGVFALISVALIAGLQVDGVARRMLSTRLLVNLGVVSYGLYLVHWPLFIVLDEERVGFGGAGLVVVRVAATLVTAGVMYGLVERPLRIAKHPQLLLHGFLAFVAASVLVAVTALLVIDRPETLADAPAVLGVPTDGFDRADSTVEPATVEDAPSDVTVGPTAEDSVGEDSVADTSADDTSADDTSADDTIADDTSADDTTSDVAGPTSPLRVAMFGDSIPAWLLRDAAPTFDRDGFVLLNGSAEACDGMVDLPTGRDRRLDELVVPDDCLPWTETYPDVLIADGEPANVGLLVLGQAPVIDRFIDGAWRHPCDGIDWYLDDVSERVEFLRGEGVQPILAVPARFGTRATFIVPDDAAERMECVRTAMSARAAQISVDVIDLDEILCPDDECDLYRDADGMHITPELAPGVLDALLDQVAELVTA